MPLRVLIVPDKFKGTLTAEQATKAIATGWRQARPQDKLELLPMSDGGDGFGAVISELTHAKPRLVRTCDAAHRPCRARWWWHAPTKTAILETARVVGLAMLPARRYHPFDLDTFGLGKLVNAAARVGAQRCLVGLGGSATNDGGFGLARALGWVFLDRSGHRIARWTDLVNLEQVQPPSNRACVGDLFIAVDVQNPLLGPRGATRIYGPQKGIRSSDVKNAEKALRRLAHVVQRTEGKSLHLVPGAGAAGGLGFGFLAFVGGRLESGFDLFADEAHLERAVRRADLVITGEGAIDRSTAMGKGAGSVAKLAAKLSVPCIGLCGITTKTHPPKLFTQIRPLTELTTLGEAKTRAPVWLRDLAKRTAETGPSFLELAPHRFQLCS